MKVALVGLKKRNIQKIISDYGFQIVKYRPDIVISYGGDGTMLYAERIYPRIPKVFLRHSKTRVKSADRNYSEVLKKLKDGRFEIKEEMKVEGIVNNDPRKRLIGLNEVNVSNQNPLRAARLEVSIDDRIIHKQVIGDGVVVATPFGSSAYFYSITRKTFKDGLGIAFNNSVKKINSMVVDKNSVIKIRVLRDGAMVIADNNPKMMKLKENDVVTIKKHKYRARMIRF